MTETRKTVETSNGGVGFLGLLTLVFIVLKLTGVISWSWVWVLAPLWIGVIVSFGLILFVGLGFLVWHFFKR